MLVSNKIFDQVDHIIELAYISFVYRLIGADYLTETQKRQVEGLGLIIGRKPLIELLYLLVRQRSTPGYRTDQNLLTLLGEIEHLGILPLINDTHSYSIEHAKQQLQVALEDTKQELKKQVKQQIIQINNEYKNDLLVNKITSVPAQQAKKHSFLSTLLLGLAAIAPSAQKLFTKAFTTTLTNIVNNAAIDAASVAYAIQPVTTFLEPDVTKPAELEPKPAPKDILVYKVVNNDNSLCVWCDSFYTDDNGNPKIYKLSELQRNGSNYGKPKSAWKPTIEATHIRCRCQLHYISPNSTT